MVNSQMTSKLLTIGKSSGCISTSCRKLPKDDIPKSGIPYDCICSEWRSKVLSGYQQTCKCKHAYIATLRYAKHPIPHDMQHRMTANRKSPIKDEERLRASARRDAKSRSWKRIMKRKIKFLMRLTCEMRQFKDV